MDSKESKLPKSEFLKNSAIYISATGVSALTSFLTLPFYTRYLSPSDYGVVALFIMFGTVLAGLLSFGLNQASYVYYFNYNNDLNRFRKFNSTNFFFTVGIFTISGLLIFQITNWISINFFSSRISTELLNLSFVSGCFEYFFTYLTLLLTAQTRAIAFFVVTVSRIVISTALSVYFILVFSYTYQARIYAILVAQSLMIICLLLVNRKLFGLYFSFSSLKKSILFAYPQVPNSIISIIYGSFDKTMLSKYKGTTSLGYYDIGARLASLMKMVLDSVGRTFSPYFMDKAHENTDETKKEIVDRFFLLVFFYMLVGYGIICFTEELVKILTTKDFYPAMFIVPVYVVFYLFGIAGQLATNQIMFSQKMHYLIPPNITSVIINIILNILLIPKLGALGAVIATAIAAFVSGIVIFSLGLRAYPLPLIKSKLVGAYILIAVFTVPIYIIMDLDIHFVIKLLIKCLLLLSFIFIGLRLNYVPMKQLNTIFKTVIEYFSAYSRNKAS